MAHFSKNRADKKPKVSQLCASSGGLPVLSGRIPPFSIVHVCLEHVGQVGFAGLHRYRPKAQKFRTEFLGLHCLHCFDRKLLLEGGTDWRICKSFWSDPSLSINSNRSMIICADVVCENSCGFAICSINPSIQSATFPSEDLSAFFCSAAFVRFHITCWK